MAANTESKIYRKWSGALKSAEKRLSKWTKETKEIWAIYKGEKQSENEMNILASNTEVMQPALYNSTPVTDVRRRYREADPVAKATSTVLQRASDYEIDKYDFDDVMTNITLDVCLSGRGVARVQYEPTFVKIPKLDEMGQAVIDEESGEAEMMDQVDGEHTSAVYVQYEDFLYGPGKMWQDVTWCAFRHYMSEDEVTRYFGQAFQDKYGKDIVDELTFDESNDKDKDDSHCKATEIWEIWDKETMKVHYLASSFKAGLIQSVDDPLKLEGFFPTPNPVRAITDPTSMTPVPPYRIYRKQAEELNLATRRISVIIGAMKIRGMYASNIKEITQVLNGDDMDLIPVSNASELAALGGLDKAVWILPVDMLINTLRELYSARQQTKQTIYEITGISDILRGATNAQETATAQQIKAQYGSLRIQKIQREIQRYARDIIRLRCEIICEHFQLPTIQAMTGIELDEQMWNQVYQLMKSEQIRDYRIDIETDSTVQESVDRDVRGMAEVLGALSGFFQQVMPLVQQGVLPFEAAKAIALGIVRKSKMGDQVEDSINQMAAPPPPQPKQPSDEELAKIQEAKATLAKVAEEFTMKNQQTLQETAQHAQKAEAERVVADRQVAVVQDEVAKQAVDRSMSHELTSVVAQLGQMIEQNQQNMTAVLAEIAKIVSAPKVVQFNKDSEGRITGAAAVPVVKE